MSTLIVKVSKSILRRKVTFSVDIISKGILVRADRLPMYFTMKTVATDLTMLLRICVVVLLYLLPSCRGESRFYLDAHVAATRTPSLHYARINKVMTARKMETLK